jgi:hypothetical protein
MELRNHNKKGPAVAEPFSQTTHVSSFPDFHLASNESEQAVSLPAGPGAFSHQSARITSQRQTFHKHDIPPKRDVD